MLEELVRVGPGQEFEGGIFPSVDKLSAPFWADGENVEFRKGGVVSSLGYVELATLPGPVNELAQAFHEGEQRAYMAVGNGVFMRSSISGLSSLGSFPSSDGTPYFETFGSFLLATNGVDPVMVWENGGDLVELEEATAQFTFAKILHRRDQHIIAFNTSNGQNAYEWCSASDIHEWDPSLQNSAGANWIRDLDSEITAVVDLGQQTAVYSRETMALLRFIGQPDVFGHTPALNGIGAPGPRAVVQVGAENYGLNRQGVFRTDGLGFSYIDDPMVHDYLEETVDFALGHSIKGYHNEDLSSVIWFFPKKGGGRAGIGYNYTRPAFRKYSSQIEVALERQVFDTPIAAVNNMLVRLNVSHNAAGLALPKWVRTKPLAATSAAFWKTWSHLKLVGRWNNAQVRFGVMEDPNGDIVDWFDVQDLAFENWINRDGVFLVLEFRADALDSWFEFSQLQIFGQQGALVSI